MARCAICLVTDAPSLVPTLVAAGVRLVHGRAAERKGDGDGWLFLHHLLPPAFEAMLYLDVDI